MTALRKPVALFGLLLGLGLLVVQFALTIPASMAAGRSLPASIVYYFSFFTILTNILLVLIYLGAAIKGQRWLSPFRRPVTRATAAASIILVGGFYHFVLAPLWHLEGLLALCTFGLHYITPSLYVLWFALWNRSGTLRLANLPTMFAYPVVYLVYVMVRGPIAGEYPYPVLDAAALGYVQVGVNVLGLIVLYAALAAFAVAIDRSLHRAVSLSASKTQQ